MRPLFIKHVPTSLLLGAVTLTAAGCSGSSEPVINDAPIRVSEVSEKALEKSGTNWSGYRLEDLVPEATGYVCTDAQRHVPKNSHEYVIFSCSWKGEGFEVIGLDDAKQTLDGIKNTDASIRGNGATVAGLAGNGWYIRDSIKGDNAEAMKKIQDKIGGLLVTYGQ